ncbi:hypothetical protein [Halovulum sp. GXIMD14793]
MLEVDVEVTDVIDDGYPVFVRFVLVDIEGKQHKFEDKALIIGVDEDIAWTGPPRRGSLRCTLVEKRGDTAERLPTYLLKIRKA